MFSSFRDIPSTVEPTPEYKFGDITKSIFKGVKAAAKKGKEERLQAVPYSSSKYEFGDFTRGIVASALTGLSSTTSAITLASTPVVDSSLVTVDARPQQRQVPPPPPPRPQQEPEVLLEQQHDDTDNVGGGSAAVDDDAIDQEERDLMEAIRRSQLDCIGTSDTGRAIASNSTGGSGVASAPAFVHMHDIDFSHSPPRPLPLPTRNALPLPSVPSSSSSSSLPLSSSSSSSAVPSVVAEGATEPNLCVVCMDHPKTMAFHPCGHMCLCTGCYDDLKQSTRQRQQRDSRHQLTCIVCRTPATSCIRIFA